MGFFGNKPPVFDWAGQDEDDHHYSLDLSPTEREIMLRLLAHEQPRVSIRERNHLVERVRLAKRRSGKRLPDATIDWEGAEREAQRRGSTVIELFEDEAHAPEPPAA